jgi:hypothetical protein
MPGILRPEDLKLISSDAEMEKVEDERKLKEIKKRQELEFRELFLAREVQPEAIDRINHLISVAAKQGNHQLQVLTFPSSYCSDGGRRINIADPEWPSTLEGFAKKAYDFFQKELRPLGYKLHAEIISFPGGMPGEVALVLTW